MLAVHLYIYTDLNRYAHSINVSKGKHKKEETCVKQLEYKSV